LSGFSEFENLRLLLRGLTFDLAKTIRASARLHWQAYGNLNRSPDVFLILNAYWLSQGVPTKGEFLNANCIWISRKKAVRRNCPRMKDALDRALAVCETALKIPELAPRIQGASRPERSAENLHRESQPCFFKNELIERVWGGKVRSRLSR